jgi:hypothetical protein
VPDSWNVPWPTAHSGWAVRIGLPIVVAAIGVAGSIGLDAYWQSRVPNGSVSYVGDLLFSALPFLVLALLMFMSGCLTVPWVGAVALLVLTYYENRSNAKADTSTAGLVFLGSWIIGIPISALSVAVEAALREHVARRNPAA